MIEHRANGNCYIPTVQTHRATIRRQSKDDYYTIYSYAHAAVSSASRKVGRGVWGGGGGGGEPANRRNTICFTVITSPNSYENFALIYRVR